jgi:DNA-binding transcriptional regulator LsrR (DeoR family)
MIMEAEVGMLIVETIAKIHRLFFVQGKAIKAICRELGVSRKVVRKVMTRSACLTFSVAMPPPERTKAANLSE